MNEMYGAIIVAFVVGVIAGLLMGRTGLPRKKDKADGKPVIGIFSGVVHDPDKIKLYQEAAIPLAKKAGLEMVGSTENPVVIEGEWPYPGFVVVERFASMAAWQRYLDSEAYQQAKRLRDDACDMHFVIGVEAS